MVCIKNGTTLFEPVTGCSEKSKLPNGAGVLVMFFWFILFFVGFFWGGGGKGGHCQPNSYMLWRVCVSVHVCVCVCVCVLQY